METHSQDKINSHYLSLIDKLNSFSIHFLTFVLSILLLPNIFPNYNFGIEIYPLVFLQIYQ